MKVIVVCEFSGIVRDSFTRAGHDAASLDIIESERPGKHFQIDAREFDYTGYDLAICHPPCTHLAVSGARWFKEKQTEQTQALEFVRFLMELPVCRIAIENPVSIISSRIRKPDQVIQPWQFGHPETKKTCLWLKNLPLLHPTGIVMPLYHSVHMEPPSPERWKNRSRTFPGIAAAMSNQWGCLNDGV